jgi:predicted ArsR family transcriptional regulator
MTQSNLDLYPNIPGAKRTGTSKLAADSMRARAPTLRDRVLGVLKHYNGLTADEAAARLCQSILSIRPRLSELLALGKIVETSERRRNQSGKLATVWRAV